MASRKVAKTQSLFPADLADFTDFFKCNYLLNLREKIITIRIICGKIETLRLCDFARFFPQLRFFFKRNYSF